MWCTCPDSRHFWCVWIASTFLASTPSWKYVAPIQKHMPEDFTWIFWRWHVSVFGYLPFFRSYEDPLETPLISYLWNAMITNAAGRLNLDKFRGHQYLSVSLSIIDYLSWDSKVYIGTGIAFAYLHVCAYIAMRCNILRSLRSWIQMFQTWSWVDTTSAELAQIQRCCICKYVCCTIWSTDLHGVV